MAVPELWQQFEKAITAYTGLSPAAFFSAIALAFAVYYVISGLFSRPEPVRKREVVTEESVPLPPPVQIGEVSEEELRVYDGSDPKKPLLMAIKGQIYDVSQSRMFYGPGGPYALFAGKDASRALAKMSFEEKDLTGDISGLGPFEIEALQDWEYKFMSKYVKVGTIKKTVPVTDESSSNPSETVDSVASANENSVRDYAVPDHVAEAEQGQGAHGAELRGDCPADDGAGLKEETPAGHLGEPKEHVPTDHGAELKDSPAAYVAEVKESGQANYAESGQANYSALSQEDQPADDILLLKDVHVGQEEKKG